MGACFSDVMGGKQAIGGLSLATSNKANDGGTSEAIHFFYQARGFQSLFTDIEVISKTTFLLINQWT